MEIGVLHRIAFGFTGVVVAIAVLLCLSPVGSAPASNRAAYTGRPKAEAPKSVEKAAKAERSKPKASKPDPKPHRDAKPKLPEVANAAGEPLDVSAECEDNLALAAKHGLTLPDGWAIHCVGPGSDWNGNSHWGVTCPYDSCPEGAGPYVSISNPTYYVVAHELCHANNGTDELAADACAAAHGASLAESPYQ
jgi:hypothetical protein